VAAGGGQLVLDADFTPAWVSEHLVPLLQDRATIAEMAARASTVGVSDGTDRMVALIGRALKDHVKSDQ
jgi:UDP-N-acetylglucosamine--N-acetylmuramyl-(pentapeptide) pyrophosphoryl-undecaprenol N-acetylglucosamine transferase